MILDTKHKRKSFAVTLVILSIIVLLMFLSGMKYLDPPQEKGIAIVFGTTNSGMGQRQPPPPPAQTLENEPPQQKVEEPKLPETPSPTDVSQEVITQETNQEVNVVAKPQKKKVEQQKKEQPKPQPAKEIEKPKPSSQTTDALANILGASKKTDASQNSSGQGDDNVTGHKGSIQGNPYASSYYGNAGSGSQGNRKGWGLNGRNLKSGEKIPQECNEFGRVVVEIEVDRTGKVVKTKAGVRGTTNSHPCLLEAAEKTARTYRWNQDDKAPQRQIGFIEINFRLGE